MTLHYPDTCKCVADVEKKILLEKCTKHETYEEMLSANQAENTKFGNNPTKEQIKIMIENKEVLFNASKKS